jgi:tRNA (guanine-N7-)-methyltransferase
MAMEDSLIYPLPSLVRALDLRRLFAHPAPLEVELGSGDGSFIVEQARRNPDRNFLGVERLLGRLRRVQRKGLRAGLTNLRIIRIEAGYFVKYLLPPASVQALHVYFPDPWPKKKHARHRLIAPPFVESLKRVLAPGGCVYLRTDDESYHGQIESVFRADPAFRFEETPILLAELRTDFEREFNARGVATLRRAYRFRTGPVPGLSAAEGMAVSVDG